MMGIYLIRNIINDKMYIGQSIDIERRWSEHKNDYIRKNKYPLYKAFKKYGLDNFDFTILEFVKEKDNLTDRETFWYDKLIPEYNLAIPNESGSQNYKSVYMVSLDDNSIINKFKSIREATKFLNLNNSHISQVCNGERNQAHGYGWSFVKDWNDSKKFKKYVKKIVQFNLKTKKEVQIHDSLRAAARSIDGGHSHIAKACKGEYKQYKGFGWRYE
jgi:hypothetical protein